MGFGALCRAVALLTKSLLPALPPFPPPPSPSKRGNKGGKSAGSKSAPETTQGLGAWTDNEEVYREFGTQILDAVLSTALNSIEAKVRMDGIQALCRLCFYMRDEHLAEFLDMTLVSWVAIFHVQAIRAVML